jgi:hypothetical protein
MDWWASVCGKSTKIDIIGFKGKAISAMRDYIRSDGVTIGVTMQRTER